MGNSRTIAGWIQLDDGGTDGNQTGTDSNNTEFIAHPTPILSYGQKLPGKGFNLRVNAEGRLKATSFGNLHELNALGRDDSNASNVLTYNLRTDSNGSDDHNGSPWHHIAFTHDGNQTAPLYQWQGSRNRRKLGHGYPVPTSARPVPLCHHRSRRHERGYTREIALGLRSKRSTARYLHPAGFSSNGG